MHPTTFYHVRRGLRGSDLLVCWWSPRSIPRSVATKHDDVTRRLDVAWGGFNVVQASLNAVAVALEREIPFHWLWILSGTTYPIVSNDDIRAKLASHHPESVSRSSHSHSPYCRCCCCRRDT